MRKLLWVVVCLSVLVAVAPGCRSSGSREFIPGRGWVPN